MKKTKLNNLLGLVKNGIFIFTKKKQKTKKINNRIDDPLHTYC